VTESTTTLDRAQTAYERGDFKIARASAREVLADTKSLEDERDRARTILRATGIDPVATLVFAGTAAILVYLVLRYIL